MVELVVQLAEGLSPTTVPSRDERELMAAAFSAKIKSHQRGWRMLLALQVGDLEVYSCDILISELIYPHVRTSMATNKHVSTP